MEASRGLCGTRMTETGRRPDIYFDLRWLWFFFFVFTFLVLYSCSAILKVVYLLVKINLKIVVINVLFFNCFFSFPSRYIASQKFHELEKQVSSCKPFFGHGSRGKIKNDVNFVLPWRQDSKRNDPRGKKLVANILEVNHLGDSSGNVQLFWVACFGPKIPRSKKDLSGQQFNFHKSIFFSKKSWTCVQKGRYLRRKRMQSYSLMPWNRDEWGWPCRLPQVYKKIQNSPYSLKLLK